MERYHQPRTPTEATCSILSLALYVRRALLVVPPVLPVYYWFLRDHLKTISIFNYHWVLEQLNIFMYTTFCCERVLRFVTEYA